MMLGGVLSRTADAQQPKAVVLDFAGAGGSTARVQVLRGLRGRVAFAKKADAERIAASQSLELRTDEGREALCEALDTDYVFWGRVNGRGPSARTEIWVAGRSGAQLTGYEAGAPGTLEGNELIQQAAGAALTEGMALSPPGGAAEKKRKTAKTNTTLHTVTELPRSAPPTYAPATKQETPEKPSAQGEMPVFQILVGGGVRLLDIDFNVGTTSGGTDYRGFDSGAFFDVGGRLLIRPMGRSDSPARQAFVIEGDGGAGIGLDAALQEGVGGSADVKTWRASGQLGYLYPIKRLQVGGLVGAGVDAFDIDSNSVLPSRRYLYLRIGAAVAYTILEDFLGFRVDGGFRWPFALGDIDDAFGNNSSAVGFDAAATLGGQLDIGFTYGFRYIWERYKLDFAGATQNVPAMGGPGGDGTDQAMTFQLLVGWSI
jgi:hypothetical protein